MTSTLTPMNNEIGAAALVRVISRRWAIVIAPVVVALSLSIHGLATTPTQYTSSSDVLINEAQKSWTFGLTGVKAADPVRTMQTQAQIAQSQPVWDGVDETLGKEQAATITNVVVEPVDTSDILRFTITTTDQSTTVSATNAFTAAYTKIRLAQAAQEQRDIAVHLSEQASEINNLLIDNAAAMEAETRGSARWRQLDGERNVLQSRMADYDSKAKDIDADALALSSGPQISESAHNTTAVSKHTRKTIFFGFFGGLVGGITVAFVLEFFDDRLKTRQEVESLSKNVPILGSTPKLPNRQQSKRHSSRRRARKEEVAVSDAWRVIRSNLTERLTLLDAKSILVTSSHENEGRTTTAASLAVILARSGKNVILVDGSTYMNRIAKTFAIDGHFGLAQVITGESPLSATLQNVPAGNTGSLRVLPAGSIGLDAATLFEGPRLGEVMSTLKLMCDFVIVDGPSGANFIDASTLARCCDTSLITTRKNFTRGRNFERLIDELRSSGIDIAGITLLGFGDNTGKEGFARYLGQRNVVTQRSTSHPSENTPVLGLIGLGQR